MHAVDELLRLGLIRTTDVPGRFGFRHPLIRRAVYEAAAGGWRLGVHERCAQALAARGASAAARAHHIQRSARQGDLAAVAVLREAGEATALGAPADHKPDRINVRDGPAPDQGHQGTWLPGGGPGHGVQAHRGRPGPLALRQRPAPGRPGSQRSHLRQRQTRRTARGERPARSSLKDLDPQVLMTIAPRSGIAGLWS